MSRKAARINDTPAWIEAVAAILITIFPNAWILEN